MREFSDRVLGIIRDDLNGLNLTRITNPDEFYNKQVLDSLSILEQPSEFLTYAKKTGLVVDIGFGGGFPILALAYRLPELNFIGIEARKKKVEAVQLMANKMEIKNITLIHSRMENILIDKECVLTFKAVGSIERCLKSLNYNKSLTTFFYKGPNLHELEVWDSILNDWQRIEEKKIKITGTDGRIIIGFRGKKVPRGTKSTKELVKLSKIL